VLTQLSRNRLGLIGLTAAVFALLLSFMLTAGAHAQGAGGMSITIEGSGVDCDGNECIVDNGTDITATVEVKEAPGAGYIGIQTQVRFNELIYNSTATAEEEIVVAEDGFPGIPLRSIEATTVNHGMTAGTPPEFATSDYTGPVVVLAFTCTDEYSRNDLSLTPYDTGNNPLGSGFKLPLDAGAESVPAGSDVLVHCGVPPTPTPVPTPRPGAGPTPTLATEGVPGTGNAGTIGTDDNGTGTAAAGGLNGDDGSSRTGLWIALAALAGVAVLAGAGGYVWMQRRQ
jgi:hypothetical protein